MLINPYVFVITGNPLWDNLYAAYKAESNANDSLGVYNGTAQGGLTYSTGKDGNAFDFNGTTAYVELPSNSIYFPSNTFSMSFWIYCRAIDSHCIISNFDNSTGNKGFYIDTTTVNTVTFRFVPFNSVSLGVLSSVGSKSLNTWYNVVITVNGTSSKMYVNGSLESSLTLSNTISFFNGCKPIMGGFRFTNLGAIASYKNMKIDESYIWDIELTSTDVTELYNTGAGTFY